MCPIGERVWKVNSNGIVAGYPKAISDVYPGLPNIQPDAAVRWPRLVTGFWWRRRVHPARTYIFKVLYCHVVMGDDCLLLSCTANDCLFSSLC